MHTRWNTNTLGILRHLRSGFLSGFLIVFALATTAVTPTQSAWAETEYAAAWGPSVGTTVPLLSALDQHGTEQNLETLTGTNGLLFVFNRSVDW